MGLHDSFGHYKHKLWPKEGSKVKLVVWLPTIKSQESLWFPCLQVAYEIPLKRSWQGLQLCFRGHLNQSFSNKIMGPQSHKSPNFENFDIPIWESQDKMSFGASLMARHKVYYKGEGGGFPQVQAIVNLVNPCLPVLRSCTKVLQLRINQLVVWFV
jgi:hypothetical protein